MTRPDLKDLTLEEMITFGGELGLSPFRGRQIFSWLFRPGITGFSQMTDLSKELREQLAKAADISVLSPARIETSTDGTRKYAFRLADDAIIESVLIPDKNRKTLCLSSQVGCAMGCRFCLTGTLGLTRNLRPAEMVNQVLAVQEAEGEGKKGGITNLVFMGMGEPLANFENLVKALRILLAPSGLDFSGRRITVSTCGIVPRLKDLGESVTVSLAVSLHAADDPTRDLLMPINRTYPLDQLLAACQEFPLPKRRRITFEYVLIKEVNDSREAARKLVKRLAGIRSKVNLLALNEAEGIPFYRPSNDTIRQFQEVLLAAGLTATLRDSRGADISAACGQLAGRV